MNNHDEPVSPLLTDAQITAIFQAYGTGRADGFSAAARAIEDAAVAAERERCAGMAATIEAVQHHCEYVMRYGTVNEQGVARTVLHLLNA